MLFCNIPFSSLLSNEANQTNSSFNVGRIFGVLNARKEQRIIESYSVTQTTLEQIFVQLAGEDEEILSSQEQNNDQSKLEV